MIHTYFDINQITRVKIYGETLTQYRWIEEGFTKPVKAFGITIQKPKKIEAGWSYYPGNLAFTFELKRTSTEELVNNKCYRVELKEGRVYRKARVEVILRDGSAIASDYFGSTDEAVEWVNSLLDKTNKQFEVITH